MLCGGKTREESSHLEEEEKNTIPIKERVYNSQERQQWQLKENKSKQQQNPPPQMQGVLNN